MSDMINAVEIEERSFELAQRKAKIYSSSSLVPKEYSNNIGNVLIAQNMASRMGADVLMVMQNLYVVHGKPGWSAQFLIACFNSCGRFSAIRYKFSGKVNTDSWGCIAYAVELATGEVVEGTEVTIAMAKAEGWVSKNGSKWKTMPELMMRYRAATFLIRTTAPEIGLGIMTTDEITDVVEGRVTKATTTKDDIMQAITANKESNESDQVVYSQNKAESVAESIESMTTAPMGTHESQLAFADYVAKLEKATKVGQLRSLASSAQKDEYLDNDQRESILGECADRIALIESEGVIK
jgi:hypothetical protein